MRLFALVLVAALASTPPVTVVFRQPDRFTDVKGTCFGPDHRSQSILDELAEFIRVNGRPLVPAGRALEITVTDVDLAGEYELSPRGTQRCESRIYREVYAPRVDLEFRLLDADGRVLGAETRRLRDPNYPSRVVRPETDPLRHEKRLLLEWLQTEFAIGSKP
jgi:hypothetical protein